MPQNQLVIIHNYVKDELAELPSIVYFNNLYRHLGLPTVDAAYRRYERGTLGVRVREFGSRLGVLKIDLALFLTTGVAQEQPIIAKRKAKNPRGRKGLA